MVIISVINSIKSLMSYSRGENQQLYFQYQKNKNRLHPQDSFQHRNFQSYKDSFEFSEHLQSSRIDHNNYEQEVQFLKDKLIETHSKLMKQLEYNQQLQDKISEQQRVNDKLREDIQGYRSQIAMHRKLQQQARLTSQKSIQKYRSVENKLLDAEKKGQVLKSDLDVMRNKMLQVLVQKNQLEEYCNTFQESQGKEKERLENIHAEIKEKNNEIQYMTQQIEVFRSKLHHANQQIQHYQEEVHKLKSLVSSKNTNQNELDQYLKLEKDKNVKLIQEIMSIQAEHKESLNKTNQLEQQSNRLKDQIYWLQKNQQQGKKFLNQQLEKVTQQLNSVNSLYRQKERELEALKRKPLQQAQKRRIQYQNTKQFVKNLQSEQKHIPSSKKTTRTNPITHLTSTQRQYANTSSASRQHNSKPKSSISRSPKSKVIPYPKPNQNSDNKYISIISEVNELENALLSCNIQKKKIVAEIDRIDDTKVKTKDIIGKRRRLEEQLNYQDGKINKIKEQLRKMKVM